MSRLDKIIDKVCKVVATKWFLIACLVLTFIPIPFPSLLGIVGFISSSVLQLNLLPILSIGQDKQSGKIDDMIKETLRLSKHIEKLSEQILKIDKHIHKDIEDIQDELKN